MKKTLALLLMLALVFCAASALAICETHTWGEWQNEQSVNVYCGTAQPIGRVCTVCGAKELGYGPIREHSFGEWSTVRQPTCSEAGEESHSCSVCKVTESRSIPPTGNHQWGDWVTVTAPTCIANGVAKRSCSVCHSEETSAAPALGHSMGNWTTVKEPNCYESGEERRTCANCGAIESNTLPVLEHAYGNWTTVTETTCTELRQDKRVCWRCDHADIRYVKSKNHVRTDALLRYDRFELMAYLGCPDCGEIFSTVDLSKVKEDDWTEWVSNGNGTHSRRLKENPAVVQIEGCYLIDEADIFCGACHGIYFHAGTCVALTDITMLSTLDHTNDELYESTILCIIPAGATYYVTSNADFPSVIYNGMEGFIYCDELNFVFDGACVALTDIPMLSTLEHTNDELSDSTIMCIIPAGATYDVISDTGDFATIIYNGMNGYIASRLVTYLDQSVPHWLDWEYLGNGTHIRYQKEDESVVQKEPCYLLDEADTFCGACHASYIHSGTCVAPTDIIMLSTLEHTNDELYESTILCTIPAGATYYVTSNADFSSVIYNGMEGFINCDGINFVEAE